MARVLELRNVLELINHTFNNGSLSQQDAIGQGHRQTVLGIRSELGYQLDTESLTQQIIKRLGDVALVAKNLSEQLADQSWNRLTVINVTGRQHNIEQFTPIIDDQVQLEAEKPTGGSLFPTSQPGKNLVRGDTLIETHIQRS